MREHPILFSTEMVQAILEGYKTQTRRILNPQPTGEFSEPCSVVHCKANRYEWRYIHSPQMCVGKKEGIRCPYGQVGDLLWVKETWGRIYRGGVYSDDIIFKTDRPDLRQLVHHWNSPLHLPKHLARIWPEITGLRVERLQEISQEDIEAEGLWYYSAKYRNEMCIWRDCVSAIHSTRIKYFKELWDSLNAKPKPHLVEGKVEFYESYPWEDIQETRTYRGKPWYVHGNPWVWVISFSRRKQGCDNVLAQKQKD